MTELPPHKKFEQQIERIHQLLEVDGTEVTWNDHIPDPDRPEQPRQIDVAIRRDGALTIVECRLHKTPQDVTWIEALIGRRTSLEADSIIAVSSSGFTKTALDKAARYGIILRDFSTLSVDEVQNWGKRRSFKISYCEFSSVKCIIKMNMPPTSSAPKLTDVGGKPLDASIWRLLFQNIMHRLDKEKWPGVQSTIKSNVDALLLVDGQKPSAIQIITTVRRIISKISLISVSVYTDPLRSIAHAEIGKFDLGASEIIENRDDVAILIDLNQIEIPNKCCFEMLTIDSGRVVSARIIPMGMEAAMNYKIPIDIQVEFSAEKKVI